MTHRFTVEKPLNSCIILRSMAMGIALIVAGLGAESSAEQWSQFRGAQMDGVATSSHPSVWSEDENIAWVTPLEGEGWSCPIVWEDRLFLTEAVPMSSEESVAAENSGASPEPSENRRNGGSRRDDVPEINYRLQVVCIDAKSGNELWRRTAREGRPVMPRHSSNTYATETPVTDGERVYAYFGMMGLYCFDLDGVPQWKKDLGSYPMRAGWGTSSSPVLLGDKLYLQIDNEQQSFLIALDAATGEEIWRVPRDEKSQYSTPFVWRNSKREELVVGGTVYRSYDPATGELLWKLDMEMGRSSATPVAVGDRLLVGTEFRNRGGADDGGGFLFAIRPGGSGDISLDDDQTSSDAIAWRVDRAGIQMASPVVCQGHVYLLERRTGTVHCIDIETGEKAYQKRIPGARAFWASPWTTNDEVFCIDSSGTTFVLAGGPEFRVIRENVVDELTWSTPAIANEALYLRTAKRLFCIKTD